MNRAIENLPVPRLCGPDDQAIGFDRFRELRQHDSPISVRLEGDNAKAWSPAPPWGPGPISQTDLRYTEIKAMRYFPSSGNRNSFFLLGFNFTRPPFAWRRGSKSESIPTPLTS